jgi:hypothetical protein
MTGQETQGMIYKISFVVPGRRDVGGIEDADQPPKVGDRWQLGPQLLEIEEVIELIPPRGNFAFLHVTCKMVEPPRQ